MKKIKTEREKYFSIVVYTLDSMMEMAEADARYSFEADSYHYYQTTIKADGIIDADTFLKLIVAVRTLRDKNSKKALNYQNCKVK